MMVAPCVPARLDKFWVGRAIAINPGRMTRTGKSILGKAAINGVHRAEFMEFAAMARWITRKSVHQYPNESTKPSPMVRPNHSTPRRLVCGLVMPSHECVYVGSRLAVSLSLI